ncbi:MAG: DNA-binding response regulator [Candidatus Binatia bacterium]|nr:MAG: DNA-binding response regulator [Candidatus Binatia bacterium]
MMSFSLAVDSLNFLSPMPQGRRILVVEDDPDILELLRFNLQQEGYAVSTATDGASALEKARRQTPDLVLLDLALPGMSGLEVCRKLREDPVLRAVPLVMVTAKADEADRIVGLELGADDYITKPFSVRELLARIRAVLRRSGMGEVPERLPEVYERGRLRVDFDRHEVFVEGRLVELSRKEFELLRFFIQNPNRVWDRLQILDMVWGEDTHVEPRTVDVHIRRLRKHIEVDDAHPQLIVTVRGVGYKFDERALDRSR